jgi:hypothetical protein
MKFVISTDFKGFYNPTFKIGSTYIEEKISIYHVLCELYFIQFLRLSHKVLDERFERLKIFLWKGNDGEARPIFNEMVGTARLLEEKRHMWGIKEFLCLEKDDGKKLFH